MTKIHLLLGASILVIFFTSCKTDAEKADALRIKGKFYEAFELYNKAANEGDGYAQWRLFNSYRFGEGVDYNEEKAKEFLLNAAKNGCDEAIWDLSLAYLAGEYGIDKDSVRGANLMKSICEESKSAYVKALYAGCLFFGKASIDIDKEKAELVMSKIRDRKDSKYLEVLGLMYWNGSKNYPKNMNKAIKNYKKAYKRGDSYCAFRIAWAYLYGNVDGIPRNISEGVNWLEKGIKMNSIACMNELADLCLLEDSTFSKIHNPSKAIELYMQAAKHGSADAYLSLGNLYFEGKYMPKDDKAFYEKMLKASELGSSGGTYNVYWCYANGVGCEVDLAKSKEYLQKAADMGDVYALRALYWNYYLGQNDTERDFDKAKKYLNLAANSQDPESMYILSKHYYWESVLFEQNYSQAFTYAKLAADKGWIDACALMADFYENGIGCTKDPQKAKEYRDKTKAQENNKESE